MSSKNNPELRGKVTELRKYKGQTVKPVRIIDSARGIDFIGAAEEASGKIVEDSVTKRPIPYGQI